MFFLDEFSSVYLYDDIKRNIFLVHNDISQSKKNGKPVWKPEISLFWKVRCCFYLIF